ncbi:hypothetical protein [Azohydromonas aeria]|uniref:hypothetical protein n=1 Tax=Azohydromonas aeria TaxID=2590212 RepID=UPI0012F7E75B|nr:hypothetical protein [Azohydromonas aeria]
MLGKIAVAVGELILAVLAQVADMERQRIVERTTADRATARAALAATGRTHRGQDDRWKAPSGRFCGCEGMAAGPRRQHRQDGRSLRDASGDGKAVLQPGRCLTPSGLALIAPSIQEKPG